MLYYYNIFLLLVQEISCYCCVLNNQSTQEKLFVSSVRWHFFVFRNSVEKLCVSWALPFIECVAVWALKLPAPHTDVLKPTSHKVFLRNYWNPNKLAIHIDTNLYFLLLIGRNRSIHIYIKLPPNYHHKYFSPLLPL